MSDILHAVWAGMTEASPLEQSATIAGIVGVWLMMRQHVATFPVGLAQVAVFGWVCYEAQLYSDTLLQVMFFVSLAYGWVHWTRGHSAENPLPVRWLGMRERVGWSVVTVVLWLAWSEAMARWTDAALPFADGFVFAVSAVSQWLQARKVMENWMGWVIANSAAIWVFWVKELYWFAVLYAIFWFMAWGGHFEWLRSLAKQSPESRADMKVEEARA